ncbi:RagB/SusD family nutrient uptake outer membrane protein [Pedobacter yulinensis]|uniref:RagB/SusD family nutrient uptake outer membrane protein n=1 Tax=Pedobacter yulinensis TaxID=2126353 RepID=A0A2T3HJU1_9SPHI|nr:RagB/SusD family nutrient uptake outer membrane protein [Pedobacter yulinensis]PST82707.1 RagB/SusD family nutrient uptake outer membrane protein [Pedobacter yulinensis]
MKNIYIIFLVGLLAASGCQKNFLKQDNPTGVTDELFWNTEDQLRNALATVYDALPSGTYQYQANTKISFSGMTDDAVWNANFYNEIPTIALGNGNPSMKQETLGVPTNAIMPIWRDNFFAIRAANRFIKYAPKAYIEQSLKSNYIAQARALRAYYHLDLLLLYGEVPVMRDIMEPANPGLPKSTRKEVVDFIVSELELAAAELPATASQRDPAAITKGACYTMQAEALLNSGRYTEAALACKKVIALAGEGVYALHPKYEQLFTYAGQLNKERILFKAGGMREGYGRLAPAGAGGTTNLSPTAALVNSYETKQGLTLAELSDAERTNYILNPNFNNNRDPRLSATILYRGADYFGVLDPFNNSASNANRLGASNSTRTGYWVKKYLDAGDRYNQYGSRLDYVLYRYADVLLMYVEALVEDGKWTDPDVASSLNQIRRRAEMPEINTTKYNSQEKLRELYRRERRVELAFEGRRLYDIRRWRIADQLMNGVVYGATNPQTNQPVIVESRKFSSKDWLWPIPQVEIDQNKNMVQNPGY